MELAPKSKRLDRVIGAAPEMYRILVEVVCALQDTTKFEYQERTQLRLMVERLLDKIDGLYGEEETEYE